jgi:hypothetical protein
MHSGVRYTEKGKSVFQAAELVQIALNSARSQRPQARVFQGKNQLCRWYDHCTFLA